MLNDHLKVDCVEVSMDIAVKEVVVVLLDTGADISLIKRQQLKVNTLIYEEDILSVKGIANKTIKTLGVVYAEIKVKDTVIVHPFHVVTNDFPIRNEGILGRDFLKRFDVKIDYKSSCIEVLGDKWQLQSSFATVRVPARTETTIRAINQVDTVGYCEAKELQLGVFIGRCVTEAKKGACVIPIINTNEHEVEITIPEVELCEYSILHINSSCEAERLTVLENVLRTDHLNSEEKCTLLKVCREYNELFLLPNDKLTFTDAVEHRIKLLPGTSPINIRPYRIPQKHKEIVKEQVEKMLEDEIVRHSTSPWNAPLLVVPKKLDSSGQQKWRVVIDFRKVNEVSIGDAYPIPNITDILDQLGKSKYFTTIDMASGFHQIKLHDDDIPKTAFSTCLGHMEFTKMPMGLKGSPATFQRLMNTVLSGLQGIKCFIYLDDIVLYASSLEEHHEKLREIFDRLRKYNLKIQPDKCEFLRKEVTYLGHLVTEKGIKPDPKKIEIARNFPQPKSQRDIKSFLGFAGYYRRFIRDFSRISQPLNILLKQDAKFEWTSLQQESFEKLKNILTSEPLLQYPDFEKEFVLTTDASDKAIGAVLSQGEIGKDLPIAYASRTLNKAETRYSTIERELLAIVWSVKQFRPYIYGRTFKIVTDHKPLTWMFNIKDPGSRLMRWRIKLEEYQFTVVYKQGKLNTNADYLSRIHVITSDINSYDDFKTFLETNVVINTNYIEHDDTIFSAPKNYSLTCIVSKDMSMKKKHRN